MEPLYIFDLDGTITRPTPERLALLSDPDNSQRWDQFYKACDTDLPNHSVIATMLHLREAGAEIWFWSGRSDAVYVKTMDWLRKHTGIGTFELEISIRMRKARDYTVDHVMKSKWLHNETLLEDRKRIVATFDDRDQVVAMWRANGITCYQVAPGDF